MSPQPSSGTYGEIQTGENVWTTSTSWGLEEAVTSSVSSPSTTSVPAKTPKDFIKPNRHQRRAAKARSR